jgi:chaperone LolA
MTCRSALSLCVALFALYVQPLTAAELSAPETTSLIESLQKHRAKFPSLTADFVEEKTSRLLQQPIINRGTISFQVPNKFRRELRGPNPSLTVSNGQKLWIYYPNFKEAELYAMGQRAFFDDAIAALTAGLNFQHVAQYYRYTAFKEEDGYRLVLTPRTGGLKRMLKELNVWVDSDYKIDRTVAILAKDDRVTTTYRKQKPTPIPASVFDYTPPADAKVSEPLGK